MTPKELKAMQSRDRYWSSDDYRDTLLAHQRRRKAERKAIIDKMKLEYGCIDCGYKEDVRALQFDHVRGVKRNSVSCLFSASIDVLSAEILKCDIRCANCHAIRTAERQAK